MSLLWRIEDRQLRNRVSTNALPVALTGLKAQTDAASQTYGGRPAATSNRNLPRIKPENIILIHFVFNQEHLPTLYYARSAHQFLYTATSD